MSFDVWCEEGKLDCLHAQEREAYTRFRDPAVVRFGFTLVQREGNGVYSFPHWFNPLDPNDLIRSKYFG